MNGNAGAFLKELPRTPKNFHWTSCPLKVLFSVLIIKIL